MSQPLELSASLREKYGKAATRRLRREQDMVPATVYGAAKAPMSIMLAHNTIMTALQHEATLSSILMLKIGDKKERVVLKALQRHPSKPRIMHIDFLRIKASEKLTMTVPLHLIGEEQSPGIKAGGILSKTITEIEIKCLPSQLPESLELDISQLDLDQSLHLSDLTLPQGVELSTPISDAEHDLLVVSVHLPKINEEDRAVETATSATEAAAAPDNQPAGSDADTPQQQ